jgi:hypothetical protein
LTASADERDSHFSALPYILLLHFFIFVFF